MIAYYLKLIRWPNLLIIAYCMFILRYSLFIPFLQLRGMEPILSNIFFLLIVLACMITAAAGYIINDIYDRNIDKINKPENVLIGEKISVRKAENLYMILNLISIVIGIYVSYQINLRSLSLLFPLVAGILYFYSTTYKTILFFGNFLVAILSALIPFTVVLFELPLVHEKYKLFLGNPGLNLNIIIIAFIAYAVFAFLISLFREIVKDIEDFEGDKAFGKNTLPVAYGTRFARIVSIIILSFLLLLVLYTVFKYLFDPISLTYCIATLILPLIYMMYQLLKAQNSFQYHHISQVAKWIMIAGISYAILLDNIILK